MSGALVIDCSVTMAWCFEDEADEAAERVLERVAAAGALVPVLWSLEVINVLAVAERKRRLGSADSARFMELLHQLPISFDTVAPWQQRDALLGLMRRFELSAYDAAYVELASRTGAALATRDAEIKRCCRALGVALA